MGIKKFYLGVYRAAAYLYWDENKTGYLFDCGGEDIEELIEFVKASNIKLTNLILTHGHGDHIGGINKLLEVFPNINVYIGIEEIDFLIDSRLSLSKEIFGVDFKFKYLEKCKGVKEGDYIGEFSVIDTPGHTRGSKCFYSSRHKIMFTGDTMFRRSYGRYDLPTGNGHQLFTSLTKLVKNYPADTEVFSAHSDETTLGEEKVFLTKQHLIMV
jgi:hydroxyacylglutathione hydrolase